MLSNAGLLLDLTAEIDAARTAGRVDAQTMLHDRSIDEIVRLNEALAITASQVEHLFRKLNEWRGEPVLEIVRKVPRAVNEA